MTILSLSRPRDLSGWNWKLRYSRKDTVSLSLKVMLLLCLNSLWARKPVGQLPGSQGPSDVCTELGRLLPSVLPLPAHCRTRHQSLCNQIPTRPLPLAKPPPSLISLFPGFPAPPG